MTHADRDRSEQPNATTRDDERPANPRGVAYNPTYRERWEIAREELARQERDTEHYRLRAEAAEAEVDRLQSKVKFGDQSYVAWERAEEDVDRLERALADERAKVARVEAALENHPRACDKYDEIEPVSCGWKSAVLDVQRALAGPEPDTTEAPITPSGKRTCPECGRWGSPTAAGLCLNSFHDRRPLATTEEDET